MHWLFIVGVSLDFSGAVLVAWTIYQRTAAETREEALTRTDANLWVVAFRLREQAYVRAGLGLLGAGFALQWLAYVLALSGTGAVVAPLVSLAIIGSSFAIAKRAAEHVVPLRYAEADELPPGIEDERHAYGLLSIEAVAWWRRNWVKRVALGEVHARDRQVRPFINHGRWQFRCPDCGPAHIAFASPDIKTVVCLTCGGEFPAVFPTDRREIERVLMLRPEENRNWSPGDTLAKLRADNRAHGLPA